MLMRLELAAKAVGVTFWGAEVVLKPGLNWLKKLWVLQLEELKLC